MNCIRSYARGAGDVPAETAQEEYFRKLGITLAYLFVGSSLTDLVAGELLTASGGATIDEPVADTLPEWQVDKLWSHAYGIPNTGAMLEAQAVDSLDFGIGSFMVHTTFYPKIPGVLQDIVGNRASPGFTGLELRMDQTGSIVADVGSATVGLPVSNVVDNLWTEAVLLVKRDPGQPGILTAATVSDEATAGVAVAAGSVNDSRPFSIGQGRGLAVLGQTMRVAIARGIQLDALSAQQIAQSVAPSVWLDPEFSRLDTLGATR